MRRARVFFHIVCTVTFAIYDGLCGGAERLAGFRTRLRQPYIVPMITEDEFESIKRAVLHVIGMVC